MNASNGPADPAATDDACASSLSAIAQLVRPGSEILELGPGDGTLARHLSQTLGCRVDCVERSGANASAVQAWARSVWEADLDEVDLASRLSGRSYDAVIAADVLEHLERPVNVLTQCRALLRPAGELFLSLPNVGHASVILELIKGRFPYREFGLLDRTHRWFFTRESVLRLLRESGYRVDDLRTIVRAPSTTEFGHRFDQLSPGLRASLLRHPDALAYQFVVRARPGSMNQAEWDSLRAEGVSPEISFRAKIYWAPPGETTREDHHVARIGRLGCDRQRLVFDLPDDDSIATLRFDPSEEPGFVHLHTLELQALGERRVRFDAPAKIASGTLLRGIRAHPEDRPETFLMEGDDPHIEIQLDPPLPPGPGRRFVADMGWPASRDYALTSERISHLQEELRRERALREEDARLASEKIVEANRRHSEATAREAALQEMLHRILSSKGWRLLEWLRRWKPGSHRPDTDHHIDK